MATHLHLAGSTNVCGTPYRPAHALTPGFVGFTTAHALEGVSCARCKELAHRLPVRDDVAECTYHRGPTKGEITFGYGATHYRTFSVEEVCWAGTRFKKRWFVAEDDGLRYYA